MIISQYFYPEQFRINEIATELVASGHKVEVVTGMPNYPLGEVFDGYDEKLDELYNGMEIHRTKTRPRHKGTVNLFLNYVSFVFKAKHRIKRINGNFDVVFCFMPSPVFQLSPAIYAKNKFKCPLVCMCCDQWPESLKARGMKKGFAFWLISKYCRKVFNKCDHILNVAPSFVEYNHVINLVPKERMSWCIQHSEDFFAGCDTKKDETIKTVDLMFAGNIGKVQNVEDIIMAYSLLRYQDLVIHIFGDGSSFATCKDLVENLGVSNNVILHGRISRDELSKWYKKMDACLLTLSGKTQIGNTIPSKVSEYMSSGKTIIAAINGDTRELIKESKCGLCTEADDYKKLADLIDEYYKNKSKYDSCGSNGRVYYEKFCTLDYFMSRIVNIFEDVTRGV